ncbi:hypothetical protein RCH14_003592 [Massilia sp. MP_M2]|uniref:T6SS immunity protein Tli4 family protein n=1 Tax=Massilia sp. MP_M2 TaxID=3071713 RepID=UPI00319D8BF7
MKRLNSRHVRWVGAMMASALALVSFLANSVQTDEDLQKVAKMTGTMKTVCVGRFLIDLPAEATVRLRRGFISGYDVASTDRETDDDFTERLGALESTLLGGKPEYGKLESVKEMLSVTGQGKVFVHNRRPAQTIEHGRLVAIEDVDVHGLLRLPQVSIEAQAQGMAPGSGDGLVRVLGRFRALQAGEIPREPGFCLGHAIVLDPYEDADIESVVMFASLPGHPDLNIVLSSMAGLKPAPRLLERHAITVDRRPIFMQLAFSHLREAARVIHGLDGDELVMRVREPNFTTGYSFQWEMPGRQQDVNTPFITLELAAGTNPSGGGKPVQSTLSEGALIDLWDRIAGSLRPRPIAPPTPPAAELPATALGAIALAGDRCPHTGWWQCSEAGARVRVFGGQRQFIAEGKPMPQALLLPQPTVWQRVRGLQPSYESRSPTRWRLADKRHRARAPVPAAPAIAAFVPAIHGHLPDFPAVPASDLPPDLAPEVVPPFAPDLAPALASNQAPNLARDAASMSHVDVPLGSLTPSGAICPASGWWRCEDSEALDGTRWFAAGSLLPRASLAQRVRRHTRWTLMRLASLP